MASKKKYHNIPADPDTYADFRKAGSYGDDADAILRRLLKKWWGE